MNEPHDWHHTSIRWPIIAGLLVCLAAAVPSLHQGLRSSELTCTVDGACRLKTGYLGLGLTEHLEPDSITGSWLVEGRQPMAVSLLVGADTSELGPVPLVHLEIDGARDRFLGVMDHWDDAEELADSLDVVARGEVPDGSLRIGPAPGMALPGMLSLGLGLFLLLLLEVIEVRVDVQEGVVRIKAWGALLHGETILPLHDVAAVSVSERGDEDGERSVWSFGGVWLRTRDGEHHKVASTFSTDAAVTLANRLREALPHTKARARGLHRLR